MSTADFEKFRLDIKGLVSEHTYATKEQLDELSASLDLLRDAMADSNPKLDPKDRLVHGQSTLEELKDMLQNSLGAQSNKRGLNGIPQSYQSCFLALKGLEALA